MADKYQLKALLSAVDKITPVVKQMARNAKKHLGDIKRTAGEVTSKIGLPLTVFTGLAAGGLLAVLKRSVTGFSEFGAGLDDMSKRTTLAAGELQQLAYLAEMSDVSVEGLHTGIAKLNKNLGEAAAGKNKDLVGLLKRLGISMRDSNGKIRSGVELLPELADAFQRNTSAVTRARMGTTLFSKSYVELLPLLTDGAAALEDLRKRYARVGMPISDADVALAAQLDDQFVDLRYAFGGLGRTIGKTLAPVLVPLIDGLIKWAAANRDLIAQDVQRFVQGIADAIKDMGGWDGIYARIKAVVAGLKEFIAALGGARNLLMLLGALLLAGPVLALVQFVATVGRAAWALSSGLFAVLKWGWPYMLGFARVIGGPLLTGLRLLGTALAIVGRAFLLNPIGAVITAIAAGAYLIITNWETVKKWFGDFFDWISGMWDRFAPDWLKQAIGFAKYLTPMGIAEFGANLVRGQQAPLVGPASSQASTAITVDFKNAPEGMRVQTFAPSGTDIDTSVGYRWTARGDRGY